MTRVGMLLRVYVRNAERVVEWIMFAFHITIRQTEETESHLRQAVFAYQVLHADWDLSNPRQADVLLADSTVQEL